MGPELTGADRKALLALARDTLRFRIGGGPEPRFPDGAAVREVRGAFVTLFAQGELRGCVGRVESSRPLANLVADLALAAAREDRRFPPVSSHELATLRIEVSVVTLPAPLTPPDPRRVVIGRDGLLVCRAQAVGVLLPQVAGDLGWGANDFLAATCRKAGLEPGAWREPETTVFTFQADVFAEPEGFPDLDEGLLAP